MKNIVISLLILVAVSGCRTQVTVDGGSLSPLHESQTLYFFASIEEREHSIKEFLKDRSQVSEADEIMFLLHRLENSKYAYVRNGSRYNGPQAVRWFRWKMNHKQFRGDPIQSGEEFIERVATRSNKTGELYYVILSSGKWVPLQEALQVLLSAFHAVLLESSIRASMDQETVLHSSQESLQTPLIFPSASLN